jgi:hypothetical protein
MSSSDPEEFRCKFLTGSGLSFGSKDSKAGIGTEAVDATTMECIRFVG